jgi:hypothetical protein
MFCRRVLDIAQAAAFSFRAFNLYSATKRSELLLGPIANQIMEVQIGIGKPVHWDGIIMF